MLAATSWELCNVTQQINSKFWENKMCKYTEINKYINIHIYINCNNTVITNKKKSINNLCSIILRRVAWYEYQRKWYS